MTQVTWEDMTPAISKVTMRMNRISTEASSEAGSAVPDIPARPKKAIELPYKMYKLVDAHGRVVERKEKHAFALSRVYYNAAENKGPETWVEIADGSLRWRQTASEVWRWLCVVSKCSTCICACFGYTWEDTSFAPAHCDGWKAPESRQTHLSWRISDAELVTDLPWSQHPTAATLRVPLHNTTETENYSLVYSNLSENTILLGYGGALSFMRATTSPHGGSARVLHVSGQHLTTFCMQIRVMALRVPPGIRRRDIVVDIKPHSVKVSCAATGEVWLEGILHRAIVCNASTWDLGDGTGPDGMMLFLEKANFGAYFPKVAYKMWKSPQRGTGYLKGQQAST